MSDCLFYHCAMPNNGSLFKLSKLTIMQWTTALDREQSRELWFYYIIHNMFSALLKLLLILVATPSAKKSTVDGRHWKCKQIKGRSSVIDVVLYVQMFLVTTTTATCQLLLHACIAAKPSYYWPIRHSPQLCTKDNRSAKGHRIWLEN
jgi:hypothetical protein